MEITDEGINRIPVVGSSVLSNVHWAKMRDEHRKLLISVRGLLIGTERIRAFDMSMAQIGESLGLPGDNSVSIKDFEKHHILIHNHADSSPISFSDFESFVKRPNTLSIQAVGHDGSVSVLEKRPSYDAAGAIHRYIDALGQVKDLLARRADNNEIIETIGQFLRSITKNGFAYWRWV